MSIETSKQGDTTKELRQLVQDKFGVPRNRFRSANRARLAQMAGVSEEEYKDARGQKSLEYNLKIRDRILENKLIPLPDHTENLGKFSAEKQKLIKERFPADKQVNAYLSTLKEGQIHIMESMGPDQFAGFLSQELRGVELKKKEIQENMGIQITNETADQLANLSQLAQMRERLDLFLDKHKIRSCSWNAKIGKFDDPGMEKNFQKVLAGTIIKKEYNVLVEKYGEKGAKERIKLSFIAEEVKKTEEYKQLDATAKAEFGVIESDMYIVDQSLGIDMTALGFEQASSDAVQSMRDVYIKDDLGAVASKASIDPDVTRFFDASDKKLSELVKEEGKDKSYYKDLMKMYPELDTMIASPEDKKTMSGYLEYLNDDMTMKESVQEKDKGMIIKVVGGFKDHARSYEQKLLDKTNMLTKNTAVEQCIAVLGKFMDVNIDQKESIMQQFKITDAADVVSEDLTLHIQGKIDGKKVNIAYNLSSGKVYCSDSLYRNPNKEDDMIVLDGRGHKEDGVPLITLPALGDFIQEAYQMDYKKLIGGSSAGDEYAKRFTEKLQQSVRFPEMGDMGIQQDMLRKNIVKNMITQDIYHLTGRKGMENEGEPLNLEITREQYPQMHAMYNLIYRSMEYFSMDQMLSLQRNIAHMLQKRDDVSSKSSEDVLKLKDANTEMFVLQSISNRSIIPDTQASFKDQGPEEILASLFKCFEMQEGGVEIIDIEKMNDFLVASEGTNKIGNKVGKRERDATFTKLVNNLETKISTSQADRNLEMQLGTT